MDFLELVYMNYIQYIRLLEKTYKKLQNNRTNVLPNIYNPYRSLVLYLVCNGEKTG